MPPPFFFKRKKNLLTTFPKFDIPFQNQGPLFLTDGNLTLVLLHWANNCFPFCIHLSPCFVKPLFPDMQAHHPSAHMWVQRQECSVTQNPSSNDWEEAKNYILSCYKDTELGQPLSFPLKCFTLLRGKGFTQDFIQIIIRCYVRKRVVTLQRKLLVNS